MRLKKIRMVGFKSFADETIIELDKGITAIVGPNGCGKSNIMDAVRWVLGEKSAKGLRGKSMDDVIFLGSEYRKQAGMAEVEMHFDNADRTLDVDMDEILIGRRIYLNSGSEYLLNGKRTTRRELERTLMDTGIGKSSYSIMEQGRMSQILKSSPEERRVLFDEAAGVSRFKAERKETMARLADTEQNMLRLNDILKNKEDELKNLDRQARKTREYLKLKEYLDKHDRNLRYLKHEELETRRLKVDEKLKKLQGKRDEIFKRLSESEQTIETNEEAAAKLTEDVHRLDMDYHQALAGMESMLQNIERLATEGTRSDEKLEELKKRLEAEIKLNAEVKKKMDVSKQLELDLSVGIKSLQDSLARVTTAINEMHTKIEQNIKQEESNNNQLSNIELEQGHVVEELKNVARDLIEELESRKKQLAGSEEKRIQLRDLIVRQLGEGHEVLNQLAQALEAGDNNRAAELLRSINMQEIGVQFKEYESIEDMFRSLLFGKTGLLAQKEELDRKLDALSEEREKLIKDNAVLIDDRKTYLKELERQKNRKVEVDLQIKDNEVRRESSLEARESITVQLVESDGRVTYYNEEIQSQTVQHEKLKAEHAALKGQVEEINKSNEQQIKAIEEQKKKLNTTREEINKLREESKKDRESVENILPDISEQERRAESVAVSLTGIEEDLYSDFQMSIGELVEQCKKEDMKREKEESEFRRIKGAIQALGQFNPLAIEELERCQEAYDQIIGQRKDIEEAQGNIMKILDDIDDKSRSLFTDTFARIQTNFVEIFQTLFGGGNASLTLMDPEDPLNCGVDIMVQPAGKKNTAISLLSGGEQNMTAIALMFATYLVRPSPFCFLDEIDAPLDDTNVKRFLKMLGGFSSRSQFMVISHNKLTMAEASGIFGVTQEELGVSKLVSVKLKEAETVVG